MDIVHRFPSAVGAVALALCAGTGDSWLVFRSSHHFEVRYPPSWPRIGSDNGLGVSTTRLELRSSPGGAEAVVIKRGQALLVAREAPDSEARSLPELIVRSTRGEEVLTQRTVPGSRDPRGCPELREVVGRAPVVPRETVPTPPPMFISAEWFCQIGRRRFVTSVTNYEGDAKQPGYRSIALRVARSLAVTE